MPFIVFNNHWPAQSPREGFVLFLDKKNQKSSQRIGFFAAQAFTPQSEQNHGLQLFCPASLAHSPPLLQKLAMPPAAAQAAIVLPAFARSLPADRVGKEKKRENNKTMSLRGTKQPHESTAAQFIYNGVFVAYSGTLILQPNHFLKALMLLANDIPI
ncbi:hypothetical protein [Mucilaginibacter kameinonensis]|uniref:hypothetical protein n=1 Tax=Mucilaginibacter kameinonensis TaxID=452286 RepID=UPI000EF78E44|nr:hypothetical protein [Mucilaginibacter kameinonensis]